MRGKEPPAFHGSPGTQLEVAAFRRLAGTSSVGIMRLSKAVTETALFLKKRAPRLYASIRNNAPRHLRSKINETMTVSGLGSGEAKDVFTNIFVKNWWNNSESRSGWGAELKRTEAIRAALPDFVRAQSIASLLDAPCGDYHWMQHVAWPDGFRYVGADIVRELIAENRSKYPGVEFVELDVLTDDFPDVDAWFARDLMIHFPDAAVRTAIGKFRSSSMRYLLTTTYPNAAKNVDIKFGQVRHLNLCASPFNLPKPFGVLREDDDPVTGRVIGVWQRTQLA